MAKTETEKPGGATGGGRHRPPPYSVGHFPWSAFLFFLSLALSSLPFGCLATGHRFGGAGIMAGISLGFISGFGAQPQPDSDSRSQRNGLATDIAGSFLSVKL